MKISHSMLPYLNGTDYSNGLDCSFELEANDKKYVSRSDYLTQMVKGKKIIHIGCVDHNIESIEKKISKGKWLHKLLCETSQRCVGIDIQEKGINFIRSSLGYKESYVADVTQQLPEVIKETTWDYILLPEVLEHIDNPVDFLSKMTNQLSGHTTELVITVPNAFHKPNLKNAVRGREIINSDHRFWFTPYTLAKIVTQAGLSVNHFAMTNMGRVKKRSLLKNQWYSKHPLARSNIIMHVKIS